METIYMVILDKTYKQYNRFLRRIEILSYLYLKKKAIKLLLEHLKQNNYPSEIEASGLIRLGHLYVDIKDFKEAAEIYHKAYSLVKDLDFRYTSNEKKVLSVFQKANRQDLYSFWQKDFVERIKYDKRFKRLQ